MILFLKFLFIINLFEINNLERISNESTSNLQLHPYLAKIYIAWNNNHSASCTGIIISRNWVMSVTHCLHEIGINVKEKAIIGVCVGQDPIKNVEDCLELHSGQSTVENSKLNNELAFISVDPPFVFRELIQVAPLPRIKEQNDFFKETACYSIGWGGINEQNVSPVLKIANSLSQHICKVKTLLCVTFFKEYPCPGDSGGPLICNSLVYGILSRVATEEKFVCGKSLVLGALYVRTDINIELIKDVLEGQGLSLRAIKIRAHPIYLALSIITLYFNL